MAHQVKHTYRIDTSTGATTIEQTGQGETEAEAQADATSKIAANLPPAIDPRLLIHVAAKDLSTEDRQAFINSLPPPMPASDYVHTGSRQDKGIVRNLSQ